MAGSVRIRPKSRYQLAVQSGDCDPGDFLVVDDFSPSPFPFIRRGFRPAHRRLALCSTGACSPAHIAIQQSQYPSDRRGCSAFHRGPGVSDRKRPACWLRRAAALLAEAAEKQVLDDGVYGELSSCYHCYALDFFLQATVLAEQNRFQIPRASSAESAEGCFSF